MVSRALSGTIVCIFFFVFLGCIYFAVTRDKRDDCLSVPRHRGQASVVMLHLAHSLKSHPLVTDSHASHDDV